MSTLAPLPGLPTPEETGAARHRLADEMEAEACRLLNEGRVPLAERLSHLAADLRATGRRG